MKAPQGAFVVPGAEVLDHGPGARCIPVWKSALFTATASRIDTTRAFDVEKPTFVV